MDEIFKVKGTISTWIGIYCDADVFNWVFECPCGVKVTYPLNELPIVDTKFPCENENHWVIKFKPKETSK